jgi:hypothetical protein
VPNGGVKVYQPGLENKAVKPQRSFSCFGNDLYFDGGISFIWRFRILAFLLSRSPLRLLAGGEAIAFAVHLQDIDMMGKPVRDGRKIGVMGVQRAREVILKASIISAF